MLNKVDLPSDVAARWVAYLQMFDFEMVHIKGTDNLPADSLSRFSTEEMCEVYAISGNMSEEREAVSNLSKSEKEVADIRRVLEGFPPRGRNEKNRELISKSSNYFIRDGLLYRRPSVGHMPMRVLENCDSRDRVLHEIHGGLGGGHKGRDSTFAKLNVRYYWPGMYSDVEKFVKSCESCQKRSRGKVKEPYYPTWESDVFKKIGVDLVLMPTGKLDMKYLVVARDDFSGWVEARPLRNNISESVWKFLFEEIICRYGIITKFIADRGEMNSDLIKKRALQYGIKINFSSAYHPQSNGMVERGHGPLIDALSKYCRGKPGAWPEKLPLALWADRVTTKSTAGESPYRILFGQESVLPIEFEYRTWNSIEWTDSMTTEELLVARMNQLDAKDNLSEKVAERIMDARINNKHYFDRKHKIRKEPLEVNDMVLLYNSTIQKNREMKLDDRWHGPYHISKVLGNGAYNLRELDGTRRGGSVAGNRLKRFYSTYKHQDVGKNLEGEDVAVENCNKVSEPSLVQNR
ncbi:Retrovirus-related Pol polyprotein from transposon [Smittium culicis]|uniref:Retrovirus-related Pol polyprotein from transposon n=1 Tax=Smittium culicis TaxID=133412 RepID=A0A1R1XQK1_9FUNG|nr:Retrovirus-related Pol polyprotein from transposon [Smittium culicis]